MEIYYNEKAMNAGNSQVFIGILQKLSSDLVAINRLKMGVASPGPLLSQILDPTLGKFKVLHALTTPHLGCV